MTVKSNLVRDDYFQNNNSYKDDALVTQKSINTFDLNFKNKDYKIFDLKTNYFKIAMFCVINVMTGK